MFILYRFDEEIVCLRVLLFVCLENFFVLEEVMDFYSSVINVRIIVIKYNFGLFVYVFV